MPSQCRFTELRTTAPDSAWAGYRLQFSHVCTTTRRSTLLLEELTLPESLLLPHIRSYSWLKCKMVAFINCDQSQVLELIRVKFGSLTLVHSSTKSVSKSKVHFSSPSLVEDFSAPCFYIALIIVQLLLK